jgi:hypothetical protein
VTTSNRPLLKTGRSFVFFDAARPKRLQGADRRDDTQFDGTRFLTSVELWRN